MIFWLIFVILYIIKANKKNKKFRQNIKVGDVCNFKSNIDINTKILDIKNYKGTDIYKLEIYALKSELFPINNKK